VQGGSDYMSIGGRAVLPGREKRGAKNYEERKEEIGLFAGKYARSNTRWKQRRKTGKHLILDHAAEETTPQGRMWLWNLRGGFCREGHVLWSDRNASAARAQREPGGKNL